ncbi:DMT family transporter [Ferrovibrio sp.]|uniref:DMT family transporter n=1 Tax=Ferrovibrio sp. TaxID=1917215 RepID=UPI0025BB3AD1|nr:DMT family transporter [Ferrovibrio sp.]
MKPWLPGLAAASIGVQVGAAMVATRLVVDQAGPGSLAMLRYAIGLLCLLPIIAALRAWPSFARRDVLPIALLGIGQFALLIALLNFGLARVPAGRAALIFAAFPLLTMLVAAASGHEALTWRKSLGVLLSFLGVGIALSEKLLTDLAPAQSLDGWIGELAVLAAAFCGAVCSVYTRPYIARYGALPVGAWAMAASVGFLALLALNEGYFANPWRFDAEAWWVIGFIGLSSGIGYGVWLWALRHGTPTRITQFLSLSPVTAALLGVVWLGENLTLPLLLGLGAVLLGLRVAQAPQPGQTASNKMSGSKT